MAFAFFSLAQAAIGPTGNLEIVNRVIAPDGFNRSAIKFPPLIRANWGDTFRINTIDRLTDETMSTSTSIHWHGLFQRGTNWADGPAFVTQCPISAGNSFEYVFKADHPGTFWYHSHLSTQYCDGLRGPLVIYNPKDPYRRLYDVDDESTIITLSDWYHVPSPLVSGVPRPDSTLINGVGRFKDGPSVALAVVNVVRGKRYRFRLVSLSCDPNYQFSIDGHKMTIIEADGEYTKPLQVDSIQIFAGQRYSFIMCANQRVGNYWIRANPNIGTPGFDNGINSAILRYKGAPCKEPGTTQRKSTCPLVETNLRPLMSPRAPGRPVPGGADINIRLDPAFNATSALFTINNATYVPPTVPVLLQILSGAQRAQDLLPAGSVYTLAPNKVVELVIPGGSVGGPHPVHLHGHAFSVVRSAGQTSYNFDNPVRRDVVSIGNAGDETTIRFTTDNPGPWFFHCHINWHLELGFAVVFAEDTGNTRAKNPVPQSWADLCPKYARSQNKPEIKLMGHNPMHRIPGYKGRLRYRRHQRKLVSIGPH